MDAPKKVQLDCGREHYAMKRIWMSVGSWRCCTMKILHVKIDFLGILRTSILFYPWIVGLFILYPNEY